MSPNIIQGNTVCIILSYNYDKYKSHLKYPEFLEERRDCWIDAIERQEGAVNVNMGLYNVFVLSVKKARDHFQFLLYPVFPKNKKECYVLQLTWKKQKTILRYIHEAKLIQVSFVKNQCRISLAI